MPDSVTYGVGGFDPQRPNGNITSMVTVAGDVESAARRSVDERISALRRDLADDLAAFETLTAQQRQAAQKRALRVVVLMLRRDYNDVAGVVE